MLRCRSSIQPSSTGKLEAGERVWNSRHLIARAVRDISMRAMVDQDIPLNAGCLVPLDSEFVAF
jgi:N-methylhydantoinase B/oxoprolinase/acetone carboxylase alpha subunit